MTMAAVLTAAKTVLDANLTSPAPRNVYALIDADAVEAVNIKALPFITLSMSMDEPQAWARGVAGVGRHHWGIDIRLYLGRGIPTSEKAMAAADANVFLWPKAMADVFFANRTLNGAVEMVGGSEANQTGLLFTAITPGAMHWNTTKDFYGIVFRLPVTQRFNQTMRAQ